MVNKNKDFKYYEAVGRRKESTARVRLYAISKGSVVTLKGFKLKQGDIVVNNKPIRSIFASKVDELKYLRPLELTQTKDHFGISIRVQGGGRNGQLDAVIHGLARALEKADHDKYRPILKKEGLLTRDPRIKERRKVGTGGKARRQKQSPKR